MAFVADTSLVRARQALKQLRARRGGEDGICLACGRPVGAEEPVRLHGDTFHAGCVLYRVDPRHQKG